jgi:hypothetical protein
MTIRSTLAALFMAAALCAPLAASAQQQTDDVATLNAKLFAAVRANDIATVRLVLTNGADPMALDANGQTPAGIAVDRGYFDIAHHILGVRNQRQAQAHRDTDTNLIVPGSTASIAPGVSMAVATPQDRKPDVTWRDTTAPGQTAEISTPRLSSPQSPSVLTPIMNPVGPAARTAAAAPIAAKKALAAQTLGSLPANAAPGAQPQAILVNLPKMTAGTPNPFDPQNTEPAAPVALSTLAPAQIQAAAGSEVPRETTSGNPIGRFFNGITGIFGGDGS